MKNQSINKWIKYLCGLVLNDTGRWGPLLSITTQIEIIFGHDYKEACRKAEMKVGHVPHIDGFRKLVSADPDMIFAILSKASRKIGLKF